MKPLTSLRTDTKEFLLRAQIIARQEAQTPVRTFSFLVFLRAVVRALPLSGRARRDQRLYWAGGRILLLGAIFRITLCVSQLVWFLGWSADKLILRNKYLLQPYLSSPTKLVENSGPYPLSLADPLAEFELATSKEFPFLQALTGFRHSHGRRGRHALHAESKFYFLVTTSAC
jgi:hypothetical protein